MTQQVQYINDNVIVANLATTKVQGQAIAIDGSRTQGVRIKKMMGAVTWEGKTTIEGPLLYGIATIDLSNAEIEEALEADPQGENDQPASDQGNRQVFPLGLIPASVLISAAHTQHYRRWNWPWKTIPEGSGLKFWVQNLDSATLTTGTLVNFSCVIVQEWLR